MRACHDLAEQLWAIGLDDRAIEQAEEMLRLNPADNQGMRYLLIGWYLTTKQADKSADLRERFSDDIFAGFAWGEVLERFQQDDRVDAKRALQKARAENPPRRAIPLESRAGHGAAQLLEPRAGKRGNHGGRLPVLGLG